MDGMWSFRITLLSVVFIVTVVSIMLVPITAVMYGYDTLSFVEAGAGFTVLLAIVGFLWHFRKRSISLGNSVTINKMTFVGLVLGLLWTVEIGINNFIAPPLPARDIIDNAFWAAIALSIFIQAVLVAYQTGSMLDGVKVGTWSGFISGLVACWASLTLIVFGMHFITHDPLNVAEWTLHRTNSNAPTMAAYFAFETLAGAFLHLLVLGLAMGALLGVIGGLIGKIARKAGSAS
jgi:hypothetical protein